MRQIPNSWFRHVWNLSRFTGYAFIDHEQWTIIRCNDQFARLLEYDETELAGVSIQRIIHDEYAETYIPALERVLEGESDEINRVVKYITKTHRAIVCRAITIPVEYRGEIAFMLKQITLLDEESREEVQRLRDIVKSLQSGLENVRGDMRVFMGKDTNIRVEGATITSGNTKNDVKVFAYLTAAVIALVSAGAYLAYISGWGFHHGDAKPPSPPNMESQK